MPIPTEHKTVQSRILQYAQETGWIFVPQGEAERRRGFKDNGSSLRERAGNASLYFDDLLADKMREFNPKCDDVRGALAGKLGQLKADIFGNRDFLNFLRNRGKCLYAEESRELDLVLIDYENITNNVFEVTEEFSIHNGTYGTREDVVFLINGIPVLVIECKNANKKEAIALGVDQIHRYHRETPELFVPEQVFTATDAIGFSYGATWNMERRNIFAWKQEEIGQLEAKVKGFCDRQHVLDLLKHFILFAEKDEELKKYIMAQHQTGAVDAVINRCRDAKRTRGLVWHTQGSGKTFTMIKVAEMLFKLSGNDKPTILLLLDRNELEDQMLRTLAALGLENVEHANRINKLVRLLKNDYRGIIVSMIHKFQDMPADVNERSSIFVMIDEAHRTTGGDLGNYLMAGLPNATYVGFTGTPIDKTAHGEGTFKTFGCEDDKGYLHKYSISESIKDGTTLPLYYGLAPNEMLANEALMEDEFWALAGTEGVTDIAELDKVLKRAVNLKNFLKGDERVARIAKYVAEHYKEKVESLGYKAFLVAVDREACAKYKKELDKHLPPDYSQVVYTGHHNDLPELKEHHIDEKQEKQIRKEFAKFGTSPKILIVTEKLLTGFDAPILYAMYLDKPMRDHALLQAIARVNRPYENEAGGVVKPHGFVLDFVGMFDKLEKALAFDSDEVTAVIKDIELLKKLFKEKMEQEAPKYIAMIKHNFDDRDVDGLIEHFRDKGLREEFAQEYREIRTLYEIISPDAFLRPFMDDYATLSAIYDVVRKSYGEQVSPDRQFQKKTDELVQSHIGTKHIQPVSEFIEINETTLDKIRSKQGGNAVKVINLIKSIEKIATDNSTNPFVLAMAERAKALKERYEEGQVNTQQILDKLLAEIEENERRKREQAEKGYDDQTFFVYQTLSDAEVTNPEALSEKVKKAAAETLNWQISDTAEREFRNKLTIALSSEIGVTERVAQIVNKLLFALKGLSASE